jgi:hypothetical protein
MGYHVPPSKVAQKMISYNPPPAPQVVNPPLSQLNKGFAFGPSSQLQSNIKFSTDHSITITIINNASISPPIPYALQ